LLIDPLDLKVSAIVYAWVGSRRAGGPRRPPGALPPGVQDRDFEVWREVFDEDVELVIDGMTFRGVDAPSRTGSEA
jgi:hypothetical protein